MLSQPEEELPEMPGVLLLVLAGHLQVVEVPEDRLEVSGGAVDLFRWKVAPAFIKPKGIRKNSKDPNGVVIAVFCTSAGCIGI
jgi:hypothetical protein